MKALALAAGSLLLVGGCGHEYSPTVEQSQAAYESERQVVHQMLDRAKAEQSEFEAGQIDADEFAAKAGRTQADYQQQIERAEWAQKRLDFAKERARP